MNSLFRCQLRDRSMSMKIHSRELQLFTWCDDGAKLYTNCSIHLSVICDIAREGVRLPQRGLYVVVEVFSEGDGDSLSGGSAQSSGTFLKISFHESSVQHVRPRFVLCGNLSHTPPYAVVYHGTTLRILSVRQRFKPNSLRAPTDVDIVSHLSDCGCEPLIYGVGRFLNVIQQALECSVAEVLQGHVDVQCCRIARNLKERQHTCKAARFDADEPELRRLLDYRLITACHGRAVTVKHDVGGAAQCALHAEHEPGHIASGHAARCGFVAFEDSANDPVHTDQSGIPRRLPAAPRRASQRRVGQPQRAVRR